MKTKNWNLPKEFAEKWVSTLKSGEYKQTKDKLYNSKFDSYCCLGVACRVLGMHVNEFMGESVIADFLKPENGTIIPYQIVGDSCSNSLVSELTSMNDNGSDFYEIAEYIENNVQFI